MRPSGSALGIVCNGALECEIMLLHTFSKYVIDQPKHIQILCTEFTVYTYIFCKSQIQKVTVDI